MITGCHFQRLQVVILKENERSTRSTLGKYECFGLCKYDGGKNIPNSSQRLNRATRGCHGENIDKASWKSKNPNHIFYFPTKNRLLLWQDFNLCSKFLWIFQSQPQVLSLSGLDPDTVDLTQTYCPALNVSQCLVEFWVGLNLLSDNQINIQTHKVTLTG